MSTQTASTGPLSYSAARPAPARFNWRIIVFLALAAGPFLYFGYLILSDTLTHGITNKGDYLEVNLKRLGNFPFHQDKGTINDIPAEFRALDGKKVLLEGFMYDAKNAGERGTEFQFVWNVTACCFNGPPQVQERVYGYVKNGKDIQIHSQSTFVRVTGVLHVRVVKDETGAIQSVYDLDVESANPA